MSLIYFHIFLMSCGILFSLGFSLWEFSAYASLHKLFDLVTAVISLVFSIGLLLYLIWFIKKKKPYMNG